jgi:hypothetical protein
MRVVTTPSFFAGADELRDQFTGLVGPIRSIDENRFVWDYWHVPDQYTYFRTLALNVFRPSLIGAFVGALTSWGLAHLGTGQVTSPWLSFYVDGCRQELHTDVVQGMWSYVYSLTEWDDRHFSGGETLLGGSRLLDYWGSYDPTKSRESRHLIERIPAHFNQLCVFDSRLPHGVATVEGTRDPLQARVVLHGWFHDPLATSVGPLSLEAAAPTLATVRARWQEEKERLGPFIGQATWRLTVDQDGKVRVVELVVDNLITTETGTSGPSETLTACESLLRRTTFPKSEGTSILLFPL